MKGRKLPLPAIHLAAKTGFISRPVWGEFIATGGYHWAQKQWSDLIKNGYFVPYPSPWIKDVLVLSPETKKLIEVQSNTFVTPPYAGHLEHDDRLVRVVLGLKNKNLVQNWMTEADLKKLSLAEFSLSNDRTVTKYPDAILTLNVPGKPIQIALEMELSRKKNKRYEDIAFAYAAMTSLKAVFFICQNLEIIRAIQGAFQRARFPFASKSVGFGLVSEWLKNPESAPLEFLGSPMNTQKMNLQEMVNDIARKRNSS